MGEYKWIKVNRGDFEGWCCATVVRRAKVAPVVVRNDEIRTLRQAQGLPLGGLGALSPSAGSGP
jgi:hypothetical protein